MAYEIISGYKFIHLTDPNKQRAYLRLLCEQLRLLGTILLSVEGVNLNLAGESKAISQFKTALLRSAELGDMRFKHSSAEQKPFKRLYVKIKPEIVSVGHSQLPMAANGEHTISPQELKAWYDSGRPMTVVDTRNDYEVAIGSFEGAIDFSISRFRDLPEQLDKLATSVKQNEPVVVFCTGGIRCEKVVPLMLAHGLRNVLQLEGGILNYFKECGGAYYQGECYVFDGRISVDSTLTSTGTRLCPECQWPVTASQDAQGGCSHCLC